MIKRKQAREDTLRLLESNPVVALIGARQVGKTTLARQIQDQWPGETGLFDLENPVHLARLDDAMLALRDLRGLVIIDEIQRRPELFPLLRVLVDRPDSETRFLILGSASPELLRQSSETLAGRIAYRELEGFSLQEVGPENLNKLWLRGSFPRSFLARSDGESLEWRQQFTRTFLERDVRGFGVTIPSETLRRFWTMLAHYHGQVWNSSEFARSFGVGDTTVRRYLDLLTSTFMVRQLLPFRSNLGKRQVKSPKVYFADGGMLHSMLGVGKMSDLRTHPKIGASWESFAMGTVIRRIGARPEECFFWATYGGAELDLLIVRGQSRRGFEFKYSSAPRRTRSMGIAFSDLQLDRLDVIHAGEESYPLAEGIRAIPLAAVDELA